MGEFIWTDEYVAWMQAASDKSRYYQTIAERIGAYLPPSARVFDAGGGLGELARWLSYRVEHVTVMERDPKAAAAVRARCPQNVSAMLGDVFTYLPDRQFDALILCFIGKANDILPLSRELTHGKTFVIQAAEADERILLDRSATQSETIANAERILAQEGIAYSKSTFEIEHGQPLRSMEDAMAFFSHYSGRAVSYSEVEPLLEKTDDPAFPLYYPRRRKLGMLLFEA